MTLIIAHRGASSEKPENTIAAFERAIELGAGGIEFDVNLDDEGTPIVVHDYDNSAKKGHLSRAPSRQHDRASFRQGGLAAKGPPPSHDIPTLAETLSLLAKHDLQLVIEVKPQGGLDDAAARAVGSHVKLFTFRRRPIISSSSLGILRAFKKHHPRLRRAFVMRQPYFCFLQAELFAKLANIEGIHANIRCVNAAFVSWCHRHDLHCYCWTARTPEDVSTMFIRGVDGIIADDVRMANDSLKDICRGATPYA